MNIDEAIEVLSKFPGFYDEELDSDDLSAVQLGIAALKKIRECQKHNCTLSNI
jgi:hypothetical protein